MWPTHVNIRKRLDEYGGYDGGYYYGDGRYERKVSSMMSPIISPVSLRRNDIVRSTELLYILCSYERVTYTKSTAVSWHVI